MNLVQEMGSTFFKEKFVNGIVTLGDIVGIVSDVQSISSAKKQYAVKILDLASAKILTVPADDLPSVKQFWNFPALTVLPIDFKESPLGIKVKMAQSHNGNRCIRVDNRSAINQRVRAAYADMGGWQETYSFYMEDNRYKYLKTPLYAKKEQARELLKRNISQFRGHSMLLSPDVTVDITSDAIMVAFRDLNVLRFDMETKKLTHTKPETLKIVAEEDESVTWLL